MLSLQDIARDAAAGATIVEYMELRGIKTSATLALLSKDEHDLETTLVQPLLQGWQRADGTTPVCSRVRQTHSKSSDHAYVDDGPAELLGHITGSDAAASNNNTDGHDPISLYGRRRQGAKGVGPWPLGQIGPRVPGLNRSAMRTASSRYRKC